MTASTAGGKLDQEASAATPATPVGTERRPKATPEPSPPTAPTSPDTPTSADSGSTPGRSGPAGESQISTSSAEPSIVSIKQWPTPKNVRGFASQVNQVATMVLNGDIDLNNARLYSGLVRTVAQAMSTEVSRARFLSQIPDLSFEDTEKPPPPE
jgi:hypothetical protein